ncbi:hypothetical protein J4Q44_G00108870 [Coregonus suidteri]|uniref:Uncharacterized protein n=1 Tax=Coregonus suidteri TaxID=861788 RepID=A0AAN8M7Y8_9TELE
MQFVSSLKFDGAFVSASSRSRPVASVQLNLAYGKVGFPVLMSHRPSRGTSRAAERIGQEDLERPARLQEERLAEMAKLQELSFDERERCWSWLLPVYLD